MNHSLNFLVELHAELHLEMLIVNLLVVRLVLTSWVHTQVISFKLQSLQTNDERVPTYCGNLQNLTLSFILLQAKFQEAQAQAQAAAATAAAAKTAPGVIKPPVKKPRRKPQPKALLPQKVPKLQKKPLNRKPAAPRPNKGRVIKTPNNSLRPVGLDNSFSPDNSSDMLSPDISLSLSSDYSHGSASSPMSPALNDFQQYDSSMFESEQRDEILLGSLEHEESEHDILNDNFSVVSNGSTSIKGLYPGKDKSCGAGHSVPASVITHTPGLLNSPTFLSANQGGTGLADSRTKASPLNSKSKTNKSSKPRETKKLVNASNAASHSVESIISPNIHHNNMKMENNKIKELAFNKDPMFSPPHGLLGSNDLKSHSNGVTSDHLHRQHGKNVT